jgi:predicted transcriptional regulator
MSTVTIQLPDDRMKQLEKLAQDAQVPAEELLRARVEQWLMSRRRSF